MLAKILCVIYFLSALCFAKEVKYELKLLANTIQLILLVDKNVTISASKKGEALLYPSFISLLVQHIPAVFIVQSSKTTFINETIVPGLKTKFDKIKNEANQIIKLKYFMMACQQAMDYKKVMQTVNNKNILTITLAKGGRWAARITKAG